MHRTHNFASTLRFTVLALGVAFAIPGTASAGLLVDSPLGVKIGNGNSILGGSPKSQVGIGILTPKPNSEKLVSVRVLGAEKLVGVGVADPKKPNAPPPLSLQLQSPIDGKINKLIKK